MSESILGFGFSSNQLHQKIVSHFEPFFFLTVKVEVRLYYQFSFTHHQSQQPLTHVHYFIYIFTLSSTISDDFEANLKYHMF